ncbi:hypothetical protein ADL15_22050 [Actinoplanes awajinensis subsp. mycoplanecinus]|uniref:Uncharacterized protein n=2 Tax=Actinoplanes awajinensis TaxID=135946 RepID=A0A117MR80_9ACTN|nr:hypothetical protein ADL15_22050 [Actinoplanes awajinensis subsp. mycoplanecinus]
MPDRLWFHLNDVAQLALHAVGTPYLALTAAQLIAFAPLVPALTWQSGPDGDALTSNGLPGWYDENGRQKVARAHAWRTQDTAARVTARRYGYLPLITADGDAQLFSQLIEVSRDKHWLSLDVTSHDPVINLDQVEVAEQHGGAYPSDVIWTEATVACVPHTGSGLYPALIADGYHNIHGGVLARFDASTVTRMILDLGRAYGSQPGARASLRWAGDRVEVFAEYLGGGSHTRHRCDVIGPDPEGLYPIGGHRWTWLPITSERR